MNELDAPPELPPDIIKADERPWEALETAIEELQGDDASRILEDLAPQEVARAIGKLDTSQSVQLLGMVPAQLAAEVLEHIPESQAADLIEVLRPEAAVGILDELSTREQADLLDECADREALVILERMDPATADSIRELAAYPEDTAGAILEPEVLAFDEAASISDVVRELQENADRFRDYQVQYVHVTRQGRLIGVVRLRDLLLNRPTVKLAQLVLPNLVSLEIGAPLEQVESFFEGNDFLGLPVVGTDGELLGIVRRSAMEHAIAERSESEYRKSQGIVGGEELRSMPYGLRARRRLSWLSINIVLNVIAASVIAAYQETLAAAIALAAFLPIISDMSGCSGNQAVAVSMRELALGIAQPSDVWAVWRKEAGIALINGSILGLLLGGVAFLWQQNLYLSLIVGIALAANTLIAVSLGGIVPLVLKGLRVDPAVASGPILTTVTDMCGFFLTLSLATVWLSRLVTA